MSLWKGKRAQDPGLDLQQIESLLKQAIALDPKLAEAHLQLGESLLGPEQVCRGHPGICAGARA